MVKKFDFLVIGSGIAGMSYALKVARANKGKVAIVCKTTLEESNTSKAQGGIASVTNMLVDNFDKHIEDTMIAGDWISDRDAVEQVVRNAPEQIMELVNWGVNFDRNENGEFDLHREGGHSEFRILHHKDNTGAEIQTSLIEAVKAHPNITVFTNHFAVEIITQHHLGIIITRHTTGIRCYGAYVLDEESGRVDTFLSKVTVMATGGCEAVYGQTTNPLVATGDGIAMVYRAKGAVKDMEFIQFHPTALFNPGSRPAYLITEAMRGYGGVLRTKDGKEFMHKYDSRLSLAPRDIVARAIDNEMKLRGDEHVYLDVTHKDPEETKAHFPNIYKKCLSIGIDITKDYIPVAPAAHYLCGGITVDLDGRMPSYIDTGLKFFDHMLDQIAHHGGLSLQVQCKGDLEVDEHHTMEDVAIVLGDTLREALGDKRGIERYGFALPMDECKALVLLDLGGRIDFDWDVTFTREYVGDTPTEMFRHFFYSLCAALQCNLHISARGDNNHHLIEGVFKAFARSLRAALYRQPFNYNLPSSKGVL